MPDLNTFDFVITEEDDVMLLMYARETPPDRPAVTLNPEQHTINIYRNDDEALSLEGVEDNVFENLQEETTLLVCELAPTDNEDENEIIYTYEADIISEEVEETEASETEEIPADSLENNENDSELSGQE